MYTKLFASILDSTVWVNTDAPTKVIWITMLAMANEYGVVEAALPGLAKRAGVTYDECAAAIKFLESPDPDSRTEDHDGRRIEKVDGGWYLLNYQKYREMRTRKQVMDAIRQARKRKRDSSVTSVTCHDVTTEAEAEADTDTEAKTKKKTLGSNQVSEEPESFQLFWQTYPKRAGSNPKGKALKAYQARLRDGISIQDLQDGVARYLEFCDGTEKTGTEFVMRAERWLSPSEEGWKQDWSPPPERLSQYYVGEPDENGIVHRDWAVIGHDDSDFFTAEPEEQEVDPAPCTPVPPGDAKENLRALLAKEKQQSDEDEMPF